MSGNPTIKSGPISNKTSPDAPPVRPRFPFIRAVVRIRRDCCWALALLAVAFIPGRPLAEEHAFRVIQVEALLDSGGGAGPDFYLNGGEDRDLEVSAILDVYRPSTVYDPLQEQEREVRVYVGQLRVIKVFEETAVARLHAWAPQTENPLVTYQTVMIGDYAVPSMKKDERPVQMSLPASVLFDLDQWRLKADARSAVEAAYELYARHPDRDIVIEGYTCSLGTDEHNQDLSVKRAESVAEYLRVVKGVPEERIHVVGHGEKFSVASNDTERGRRLNRRVEFRLVPRGTLVSKPDSPSQPS